MKMTLRLLYSISVVMTMVQNLLRQRRFVTIVIKTEINLNSLKVIFTKELLTELPFLAVLMYSLTSNPKYFRFKQKYYQTRPVFPDHLSVSHDQDSRNLDEYFFHFYSFAAQKIKMKEIFFKKKITACHNCFLMLCSYEQLFQKYSLPLTSFSVPF